MKILYLTSNIPSIDKEAVERVNFEIVNELIKKGHEIYLQIILSENSTSYSKIAKTILKSNVPKLKILSPLINNFKFKKLYSYYRILFPNKKNIYPSSIHKKKILQILGSACLPIKSL